MTDVQRRGTILVSDGARCYPKLAREMKVLHRSVDHSHGVFQKWDRVRGKAPQRALIRLGKLQRPSFHRVCRHGEMVLSTHSL